MWCGPPGAEPVYFESDGSFQMVLDGVTDGGSCVAENGTLWLGELDAHVVDARQATRTSFDDGVSILQHDD